MLDVGQSSLGDFAIPEARAEAVDGGVLGLKRDGIGVESPSRFRLLFAHDLRANAFAFVARENRYTLFRIML
jgi:hypothetical protein